MLTPEKIRKKIEFWRRKEKDAHSEYAKSVYSMMIDEWKQLLEEK